MRKTEDLTSLTNSELTQRLVKIAKRVPQTFGFLVLISLLMSFAGFQLNSHDQTMAGGIVSLTGGLMVVAGAFYMRNLRVKNDALINESIKRNLARSA